MTEPTRDELLIENHERKKQALELRMRIVELEGLLESLKQATAEQVELVVFLLTEAALYDHGRQAVVVPDQNLRKEIGRVFRALIAGDN